MSTGAELGLARWHEVVASRDAGVLREMIVEDAVFSSPAVHAPQEGRDTVVAYLSAALVVLGPTLTYHDTWTRENDAVLRFTAEVGGKEIEGIDMITWDDDGMIVSFTVMVRPIRGLEAVIEAMAKQLFA